MGAGLSAFRRIRIHHLIFGRKIYYFDNYTF